MSWRLGCVWDITRYISSIFSRNLSLYAPASPTTSWCWYLTEGGFSTKTSSHWHLVEPNTPGPLDSSNTGINPRPAPQTPTDEKAQSSPAHYAVAERSSPLNAYLSAFLPLHQNLTCWQKPLNTISRLFKHPHARPLNFFQPPNYPLPVRGIKSSGTTCLSDRAKTEIGTFEGRRGESRLGE